MSFTHLKVRSGYSLFASTIQIDTLIKRAQALQISTLVLTEEEVLYSAISFYESCVKAGIKPILGMIVRVEIAGQEIPITLLAKSNEGYHHLMQLSTYIQLGNTCTVDVLKKYTAHTIGILAAKEQPLQEKLMANEWTEAMAWLQSFKQLFEPNDFYLGAEHYQERDNAYLEQIRIFSLQHKVNVVALQDVLYIEEKDYISYDCLQAMKNREQWTLTAQAKKYENHHFRSKTEMEAAFSTWPELIDEIEHITNKCQLTIQFNEQILPAFPVPEKETAASLLKKKCLQELIIKYPAEQAEAEQRLLYELEIIDRLQFNDYFLIVADIVLFAKDNGIIVGPGRGSAAGSIVAYLLGITEVDPLQYGLLFERFLNPERITMPDIDIDFSDARRDEVIDYVRQKYGQAYVAQIITFGTFAARSILRELMKTMDINEYDQTYLLKQIPAQSSASLMAQVKNSPSLQTYIKDSPKLRMLFFIAGRLEGLPRHISTHAAGIIISKEQLTKYVPLTQSNHKVNLTQYPMNNLEAIGLLKIDLLGLKNLSLLERMIRSIRQQLNKTIDLNNLPVYDEATFQLLQKGQTSGIFQLESQGMREVLMRLGPTTFDDIVAINALYRPGPMENIPTYIARKHGKQKVMYAHNDLAPILKATYGVLVYQEQIIQIVHEFAGLSYGQADILRRAISKKNRAQIDEQAKVFIQGCLQKGYTHEIAEEVFSWIIKFADYGFNKSHSVAYSKISYQLAYLKANYPAHFFAQLLSSSSNEASKFEQYIREATTFGIDILPPNINSSFAYFTIEERNVRIGLSMIKGIHYDTVQKIIEARKTGPFQDLFDFCSRLKGLKRSTIETFILAGTFDTLHANRASLIASIEQAMERAELFGSSSGQGNLFGNGIKMVPVYMEMEDFSITQKLADEKELLSIYVSSHPLKQYREALTYHQFQSFTMVNTMQDKAKVKVAGIIQTIRKIRTKRGESMAFMTLADETAAFETVLFPSLYREVGEQIKEEDMIVIIGKISVRNGKKQIVIDQLQQMDFEVLTIQTPKHVYIRRTTNISEARALTFLQEIAKESPGPISIIIYNEQEKKTYKLGTSYNMQATEAQILSLKNFFGSDHIVLR